MKKHLVILSILFMGLLGSSFSLFSQTSVQQAHNRNNQSGKFIIYYGEKETGYENWTLSTSEGKIRLTEHAQFKVEEMDFMVNMDLILDTLFSPQKLDMDGKVLGQAYKVSTEFSEGKTINHMSKDGDTSTVEAPVHKDALVLPNGLFYPYTFLVRRYDFEKGGKQEFFGYVVPVEISISIEDKGKEKVDFDTSSSQLQKLFVNLAGTVGVNLWVDKNEQIIKLSIPIQGIEVYQEGYKPAPEKKGEVEKYYTIAEEELIKPGHMIAARTISVGSGLTSIYDNWSLYYLGRESENSIQLEVREKELAAYKGTEWIEKPRTQHKVFLNKTGYTIFEIGGLTLRLKTSDNNLLCAVVGDSDNPYKQTFKVCPNGHKWEQKDYNYCPICGGKLKEATDDN